MNNFTPAEKVSNCRICTLARNMRDCAMCQFFNPETVEIHNSRTFGDLPNGATFQWGSIEPRYKKIDGSTAVRLYPHHVGKMYQFAAKVKVTPAAVNFETA